MRWFYFCMISIVTSLQAGGVSIMNDSCHIDYLTNHNNFLSKSLELENCLLNCYQVDPNNAVLIRSWFDPLFNEEENHSVIDAFIEKSKKLNIEFTNTPDQELSPDDGVLKASKWHNILFESAHIRILRGVVNCGECDPFHLHQWERLMVVIQGAVFRTEFFDGTVEIEDCPIGVYELQAETTPAAYTNIGNTIFESLIFEIKK